MNKPRIRALAVVGGLLAGALLGAPSTSTAASTDRAAANQKFVIIQVDASEENGGTVVGLGPVHAKGKDLLISDTKDKFKFPDGNLIIKHKSKGGENEDFDPDTCYFHFVEKGTWKIAKGTGAYANTTGSGTYKAEGHGVGCEQNQPPEIFSVVIEAKGNVTP